MTSTTVANCTTGCARWPSSWPRRCAARRWSRATVTTKLRYPDFSIVTRSQSAAVGFDDAERIATLACALLDRALDDRPDALRLIGVGVSGFERHVQLHAARRLSYAATAEEESTGRSSRCWCDGQ